MSHSLLQIIQYDFIQLMKKCQKVTQFSQMLSNRTHHIGTAVKISFTVQYSIAMVRTIPVKPPNTQKLLSIMRADHRIACTLSLPTLAADICRHLLHHQPRDGYPVDTG